MTNEPLVAGGARMPAGQGNGVNSPHRSQDERDILLSLNNDIASVRDKKDILHLIHPKIKQLFDTDDIFICFFDARNETLDPILRAGGAKRTEHEDYDRVVNSSFSIHDGFIDVILHTAEPVIVDIEEFCELHEPPGYMTMAKTTGLKQTLSISLHNAGETIGILTLWSEVRDFFTEHHKERIAEIANNISIVVINILANEEIAKREEEKTILLGLSNDIASLRNRDDFFEIVIHKIKKIFGVDGFAISQINEDLKTYRAFKLEDQYKVQSPSQYGKILSDQYSVTDRVYGAIMGSENPVLFQVNDLVNETNIPGYVQLWKSVGIQQVVCAALKVGGKFIGTASFHSLKKSPIDINSSLLKAVCSQLAVKVSNILAYEEIAKREEEKTILLSLSNEIASLTNRNDLFKVVNSRIKEIFSIEQFGIVKINEDRTTHSAFMMDLGSSIMSQIDFTEVVKLKYSVNDKAFRKVMEADGPVLLDVDELAEDREAPDYVRFWQQVGFRQLLCLPLRVGGNNIGSIFFNIAENSLHTIKTNLLKGIGAQLSVAVSNILANEKVLDQLNEINRYKLQLEEEKIYLKEEIENAHNYTEIIGESPEMKKVFRMVTQVAYSDTTVLILGETGTGKELVARAIHNASTRRNKLMVKVNCAALPANLIESELFGHERGSFTGAVERRIGKFELANNGTLFLDEIGEMPLDLQAKLLRALQEKEIERVGGKTTIKTDARIIVATNRDLERSMEEGKFRKDLYYRLNIFPISLPSLKDRRDDIPKLVSWFIARYAQKAGKKINTISNKALQELVQYDWPGNIRELEHLIERSVLLATGETIKEINLPQPHKSLADNPDKEPFVIKTISENEKEYILRVLKHVKGRIAGEGGAAELLGLPTSTLNSRIKKLGIRREHSG